MLTPRNKFGIVSFTAICLAALGMAGAVAQTSVSTVPTGFFTLTIPAGFGTSSSGASLSFPLQGVASADGQMAGVITGLSATTITNSNAGWTAGQLSVAVTPYLIQFTSGNAAGRTFLLSTSAANTSTTLTLDSNDSIQTPDLTQIAAVGDTYQIIPADTLLGIFGTAPAVVDQTKLIGGAGSPTNADTVTVFTTNWTSYYYDTNSGHWLRVGLPHTVGDNIVIRPDSGVIFNRYGTQALTIVVAGQVPSVGRKATVANSGVTPLCNSWPVDQTLVGSGIQNLPGWTSGTSTANADTVTLFSSVTGWRSYFYNGTNWILGSLPHPISDNVAFTAGTVGYITKQGVNSGYSVLNQALPYSLN